MTEATPFQRKYDITFLCPPTIAGDFCVCIYLDIYSKVLAERVHELKETEKEVDFMCLEMEEILQKSAIFSIKGRV